MKNLRVGYWPLTHSMDSAGDRRRLLFWVAARGHSITTDLTQRVDVIVASENCDFNSSVFLKNKAPIVFESYSYTGDKSEEVIDDKNNANKDAASAASVKSEASGSANKGDEDDDNKEKVKEARKKKRQDRSFERRG